MLLLTSVNDRLYVATSAPVPIDVHTSWVDTTNAGAINPGRQNSAITTAATTSVAGTPPATTQRNVKTLHIRNKHASTPCQVLVLHNDGVNQECLFDTILGAGKAIQFTDQGGFRLL